MKILYLDCRSGISGDMFVGSMLDIGLDFDFLKKELKKLKLEGYRIRKRTVTRQSIRGLKFDVLIDGKGHPERTLRSILGVIEKSKLSKVVKNTSRDIFLNIGRAESKAHSTPLEEVHFHEVG